MTPISILIKASIVLSVVAVGQALLARRASAATRHLMWTLTMAGLLLLPMLCLLLPGWTAVRLPASTTQALSSAVAPSDASSADLSTGDAEASAAGIVTPASASRAATGARIPWAMALPVLYAAGLLLLLTRLTVERLSIQRVARRAIQVSDPEWTALLQDCAGHVGVRRTVRLLRSCEQTMPVAFGTWRGAILIPAVADMWPDDRRRAVLLHELAHVARFDCLMQMLAAVVCAFYWIHPGVWWVSRRLRLEREMACDDLVLSAGANAREYAANLLELAFALRGHRTMAVAVSIASPLQLEERMRAVLDAARNRATPRLHTTVAGVAIAAALLVTVASARTAAVTAEELIRARDHGVTPEYVSALRELGYAQQPLDTLVRARDHGVSPEYIRDLAQLGYRPSLDDLIRARDHGVSPQYVSALRELGFTEQSLEMLVRARDHGVSPEYIRELAALGYPPFTLDELIRLRDHGVTAQYASEIVTSGNRPAVDELVVRRQQGMPSDRFRRTVDWMLAVNVRQFVWHVRCASAWFQQLLNGASPSIC